MNELPEWYDSWRLAYPIEWDHEELEEIEDIEDKFCLPEDE